MKSQAYFRKRWFLNIFMLACSLSLFTYKAFAAPKTVRVGVCLSSAIFSTDSSGEFYGYGYDYMDEIAKNSNFIFEYVPGTLDECLTALKNGDIDILDGYRPLESPTSKYIYSNFPTGTTCASLYTDVENDSLSYNDFEHFNGIKVGMISRSNYNIFFRDFAKKNNFSFTEVLFDDLEKMDMALEMGEIDAKLLNNLYKGEDEKVVSRFSTGSTYIIAMPENRAIIDEINSAIAQIRITKPTLNYDLAKKHFGEEYAYLAFSQDELDYIAQSPPINVAFDSFSPPFEYFSMATNAPAGINIEALNIISKKSGLQFNLIPGLTHDDASAAVASGSIDMLLNFDRTTFDAEQAALRLSESYLDIPTVILGKSYSIDKNAVFVINSDNFLALDYISKNFHQNPVITLSSIGECYEAIKSGIGDFTLDNIYSANAAILSGDYGNLKLASATTLLDGFYLAFSTQADQMLINIINKSISAIPKGSLDSLLLSFIPTTTLTPIEQFFKQYRKIIVISFSIIITLVICFLIVAIILQVRNKRRLLSLAYKDQLTGLRNLTKFKIDAQSILNKNPDKFYAFILIDISKFNLINEVFGYNEGDKVLLAVKDGLMATINPATDLLARMGSDEFILMVHCKTSYFDPETYNALDVNFHEYIFNKTGHKLLFSAGRYVSSPGESDIDTIFEKTNYAHSLSKQASSLNTVFDYDENMKKLDLRQREIESRMEAALENGEFKVYLQSKHSLLDGALVGAEALVRWKTADDKFIFPSEFIPVFEKNGFIVNLDKYMFTQACEVLHYWAEINMPLTTISVNFSRLHLQNDNFVNEIMEIADKYAVPRKYLEIELTESTMFDNESKLEEMLIKLHNGGFTLSMDDFGSGYSSLGLLKNLPVDVIKIDRAFFTNNKYKTRAKTVIQSVISMAKDLEIHTVAEGVETLEHIEYLRSIGCETVQGYYYSRPIPWVDFSTKAAVVPDNGDETGYSLSYADLGDITSARQSLGDTMPVAVYRLSEFAIRETLKNKYGTGEMVQVFREAGKIAGRIFADSFLQTDLSLFEFMSNLAVRLRDFGIGLLEVEDFNPQTGCVTIVISEDLDCSGVCNINTTLCHYDEGFIAGILYEYTKKSYSVIEVDCWATGSNVCRFEARPK